MYEFFSRLFCVLLTCLPMGANANDEDQPVLLIVGLGNPGDKYKGNRHNIGFMAIDQIAKDNDFSSFKSKFQGQVSEGHIAGQKVVLLKPQTYMNNSGQSVGAAAKFYKITPEQIVVLYDELDLEPGKVRVKIGGGAGGHNGIRSMDAHLPSKDYKRVRLGIGHPGDKNRVSGYVLSDFSKTEQKWLEPLIDDVARYIDLLVEGDEGLFMTRIAQ